MWRVKEWKIKTLGEGADKEMNGKEWKVPVCLTIPSGDAASMAQEAMAGKVASWVVWAVVSWDPRVILVAFLLSGTPTVD